MAKHASSSAFQWLICGLLIVGVALALLYVERGYFKDVYRAVTAPPLPADEAYHPSSTPPVVAPSAPSLPTSTSITLPADKRLAVPFTSQAPTANWDAEHEETCEEASVIMVAAYYHGESGRIDPTVAEQRIQDTLKFETDHYGFNQDTSATETKRFLEAMYPDLQADVVADPTADDIKQAIAQGYPVIIPADGKTLPNPNFRGGGPKYHMLVVRGYTPTQFITNDPGTRLGENFLYTYSGLLNSIHDWNGGDVPHGARVILVVRPKK